MGFKDVHIINLLETKDKNRQIRAAIYLNV